MKQAYVSYLISPLTHVQVISEKLKQINKLGFMTINSQPAVNGAPSTDEVFGWGPRGGFVYQKAYIEFFASPERTKRIIDLARKKYPHLTFHAINLQVSYDASVVQSNFRVG